MKRLAMAALILTLAGVSAWAVDLKNEDSQTYTVRIHETGTTHTSIGSSTTMASICSSCEIEVEGVGSVRASGGETVVIKDGALSKR
ncbi:MAG: hypothetical protein EPN93_17150 [Spirochaetes bacterium]|nr:MAG: hypothetical protein EPN93_17150 [Spirochaetota bacterium]